MAKSPQHLFDKAVQFLLLDAFELECVRASTKCPICGKYKGLEYETCYPCEEVVAEALGIKE